MDITLINILSFYLNIDSTVCTGEFFLFNFKTQGQQMPDYDTTSVRILVLDIQIHTTCTNLSQLKCFNAYFTHFNLRLAATQKSGGAQNKILM